MVKPGILLDSNVLSELRKGRKADPHVRQWAGKWSPEQLYTSVICMMEIRTGVYAALRKNPDFGILLQEWYDNKLKPTFRHRVLPVDLAIAEMTALLQTRRTLPFRDGLIAATAKAGGFPIATRNTKDFIGLGVDLINPWKEDPSNF
ncbi:MAG: type II toxin-antitoxin system VapC family toxin [Verrucomicrobia bacterium]|nr:type II toxin-antitoxin system VapC family toxin [Verrucomicrobiota bacterium]